MEYENMNQNINMKGIYEERLGKGISKPEDFITMLVKLLMDCGVADL